MKTKLLIISIAMALCLSAAPAMAALFGDGGVGLQGVLDGITIPPPSSVNVLTDEIPDLQDSYWHIAGSGASVSTMIIEIAGFAGTNTFGVYDPTNSANFVQIFSGLDAAGAQKMLSVDSLGGIYVNSVPMGNFGSTWFGYYLDSSVTLLSGGGFWYSDTALNTDNMDHMYAYQGTNTDTIQIPPWAAGLWTDNEYVLAFEDLEKTWDHTGQGGTKGVSDRDYTDMVIMVESVYVPVPGAVILGILGLGVVGLKLRKYA